MYYLFHMYYLFYQLNVCKEAWISFAAVKRRVMISLCQADPSVIIDPPWFAVSNLPSLTAFVDKRSSYDTEYHKFESLSRKTFTHTKK